MKKEVRILLTLGGTMGPGLQLKINYYLLQPIQIYANYAT